MDDSLGGTDRVSFALDSLVIEGSGTSWQFALRHGWLPSSSNKWAVFLLSDRNQEHMMPGGKACGVVLGVNFKGSDDTLRLWWTEKGTEEVICSTVINWQVEIGTSAAWLRVEREPGGLWKVYLGTGEAFDCPAGDTSYCSGPYGLPAGQQDRWEVVGEGMEPQTPGADYSGIYFRFSSRQDMKFWFDELTVCGSFIRDTLPPCIISLEVRDERSLMVEFSEDIDMNDGLSTRNYRLLPAGVHPQRVLPVSERMVELSFADAFTSGKKQTIQLEGIGDRKGNVAPRLEWDFTWYHPVRGDIIINELMFDPDPVIGLPPYEYIELYNNCGFTVDLSGWILKAGTRSHTIGQGLAGRDDHGEITGDGGRGLSTTKLPPGGYLLLCYRESGDLYTERAIILDELGYRSMLLNDGAILQLLDADSVMVDWMRYSPGMHVTEYYAGGGWSIERLDPERLCFDEENWTSSTDRAGGTPGKGNSVRRSNPDRDPPEPLSAWMQDPKNLVIGFSESLDRESAQQVSAWYADGQSGNPDSVHVQAPYDRTVILEFAREFYPGKEYRLKLGKELKDCSGNRLEEEREIRFAMPVEPRFREVLISEVLFNPLPWCPDFIELYNPGARTFDLSDLRLGSRDPESGEISSVSSIVSGHRLFFPEEYIVLTEDTAELCRFFRVPDQDCLVKVKELPAMGDIEGTVLVMDKYLKVLDELSYDSDMHHQLLDSREGVSLERISYSAGSENRSNWHSASSTEGYGTPGRRNSQNYEQDPVSEGIQLDPEVFSPDMDGIRDVLFIKYCFRDPGLKARILVFDPRGRLVREVASRQLLGTRGFFTWDGTDRYGSRAATGIYMVLAEIYGNGKKQVFRKTCVLSTGR
jgi:hypothetical protein